ncbi:hypothetical protein KFL_000730010 [Klebsormidium nitens]|uniref:Uncharacterized protein n=1 Tax=Klebsormidium nitens TaxID=105231 RepID=A0A1Y1HR95_KLENI|nr:hypothetical protein KFL_000730010 [Klebsormidium nitens]|eukprot:GAQ81164.1 hypothetical protein KFL_000730010 [Klebsormidium nitens]
MKGDDQQPGLTWMDAIGLTYLSSSGSRKSISIVLDQLLADAGKHPFVVTFGEDDVTEAIDTLTAWKSPDGVAAVHRSADVIAQLTVTIAGLLEMELTTDKDGIHFLNFDLKKIVTSPRVHGVLGQMYAPGAVEERLAMGTLEGFNHREYVEGTEEDYETSSLTAPDCSYTKFDLPRFEATTSLPRALGTASLPTQTRRKQLSTSVVECRQIKHTAKGVSLVCTGQ